jgi:hypothetical protein
MRSSPIQNLNWYFGDLANSLGDGVFRAFTEFLLIFVVKDDFLWGDEFLQRPSSREPFRLGEVIRL